MKEREFRQRERDREVWKEADGQMEEKGGAYVRAGEVAQEGKRARGRDAQKARERERERKTETERARVFEFKKVN